MRGFASIVACLAGVACGGTPVVGRPVVASQPASKTFGVMPAELGDPRALHRIDHRILMGRMGRAWLRVGDERSELATSGSSELDIPERNLVIGETGDRVRIVTYRDHSWLALWIDRADAIPVVVATTMLTMASGTTTEPAGVWLEPGASIYSGRRRADRIEVIVSDPFHPYPLVASGWISTVALGTVWRVPSARPRPDPALEAVHTITAGTVLRGSPSDDAPTLAHLLDQQEVTVTQRAGDWSQLEFHVREVRVVGFVPSSEITTTSPIRDRSEASADPAQETDYTYEGFGFTQLAIDAGACLYAIPGGEPVGVQISASTRPGQPSPEGGGWWSVSVLTDWGAAKVAVHERPAGSQLGVRRWERCAAPAPDPER